MKKNNNSTETIQQTKPLRELSVQERLDEYNAVFNRVRFEGNSVQNRDENSDSNNDQEKLAQEIKSIIDSELSDSTNKLKSKASDITEKTKSLNEKIKTENKKIESNCEKIEQNATDIDTAVSDIQNIITESETITRPAMARAAESLNHAFELTFFNNMLPNGTGAWIVRIVGILIFTRTLFHYIPGFFTLADVFRLFKDFLRSNRPSTSSPSNIPSPSDITPNIPSSSDIPSSPASDRYYFFGIPKILRHILKIIKK